MPSALQKLILSALLFFPSQSLAGDAAKTATPEWNYIGGGNNDEDWGELSPDYAKCETGTAQSPVGLDYTTESMMPPLDIHYVNSNATIEHKDRTLVIDIAGGDNTLVDEANTYTLHQIRIHTPAEHSVTDNLYVAELQLIHTDPNGKILIVGILQQEGAANDTLQNILKDAPEKPGTSVKLAFDPATLLPSGTGYFAYSGSITWPPCTEGVEWRIFKHPSTLSHDQLKLMGHLLGRNARLLQPIYLRTIRETVN